MAAWQPLAVYPCAYGREEEAARKPFAERSLEAERNQPKRQLNLSFRLINRMGKFHLNLNQNTLQDKTLDIN